jgi:hypothetical protein
MPADLAYGALLDGGTRTPDPLGAIPPLCTFARVGRGGAGRGVQAA